VLSFLFYILNKEFDKPLGLILHCHVATHVFYAQHLKVLEKQIIFIIAYMDLEAGEEYVSAFFECSSI
jgi:hypothetical protein